MELDIDLWQIAKLKLHNLKARFGGSKSPIIVNKEGDRYVIEVDGIKLYAPSALRWKLYREGLERRFERLEREFGIGVVASPKSGDLVIDAGANVGEFSLAMARRGARVIAFEADPKVFPCLAANVAAYANVTPIEALLWNCNEQLKFHIAPRRADSSVFDPGAEVLKTVTMEGKPLDNLIGDVPCVALLKCDAEGAEPEVLDGARGILSRTEAVAVDTGAERLGKATNESCEAILRSCGFNAWTICIGTRQMTFATRENRNRSHHA